MNIAKNVINKVKGMFKEDTNHKTYAADLMVKVHKDKDGTLASRMVRQFIPIVELHKPELVKPRKVWYGDKISKTLRKGTTAGKRVEGVVAGAIRLGKQERMLEELALKKAA